METTTPTTSQSAELRELRERLGGSPLILMLDVDGTLAPIASRPEEAAVPAETRRVIAALAARGPAVKVALVSGRVASDARRMVGVANLWVVGNHGAETIGPDGEAIVDSRVLPFRQAIAAAARQLTAKAAPVPGVLVENKVWSLAVHWRQADQGIVARLRALVDEVAQRHGLTVRDGKSVYELRPPVNVHKGTAVLALAQSLGALAPGASLMYVGDDVTDEDAFRILRAQLPHAVTAHVGDGPTAAEYSLPNPEAVRELLASLASRRTPAPPPPDRAD